MGLQGSTNIPEYGCRDCNFNTTRRTSRTCKKVGFGPRRIDIYILLLEDRVVDEPDLKIPHARLHERAFVLVPLAELASESIHPVLGSTIANLVEKVSGLDGINPLA